MKLFSARKLGPTSPLACVDRNPVNALAKEGNYNVPILITSIPHKVEIQEDFVSLNHPNRAVTLRDRPDKPYRADSANRDG